MNPRPYQEEILQAVQSGWGEFTKQLIVVPTGGGKTVIFSHLAHRRQPGKTLILAHREELVKQAADKLHKATGIIADIEQAQHHADLDAPVVVASIQSIQRRLHKYDQDHFDMVICDEAHHAISPSWQEVLRYFDGHADILGVTATPDRGDKRNLGEYFQNVAAEVNLFDLIDQGYLSRITIKTVPVGIDLTNVSTSCGDFSESDLGEALDPYLVQIAEAIRDQASFRRTLVFLPLRATSRKMVDACRQAGLRAEHIDGDSPDRAEILKGYAAGEFDVLCNAMLLTEGFDDPGIDCVVVLRPTRSRALYSQMIGRGTRIDETKDDLLLLDFLWMHQKHAVVRPAHLVAASDEEAEWITKEAQERQAGGKATQQSLDLRVIASETQAKREEALRKQLVANARKNGQLISADQFALHHQNMVLAEYEPTMKWESLDLTDKQIKALKRAKINPSTVRGRGHANKILGLYFKTRPIKLASPKQIAMMKKMGFPDAETATSYQAAQFFKEFNNRRKALL